MLLNSRARHSIICLISWNLLLLDHDFAFVDIFHTRVFHEIRKEFIFAFTCCKDTFVPNSFSAAAYPCFQFEYHYLFDLYLSFFWKNSIFFYWEGLWVKLISVAIRFILTIFIILSLFWGWIVIMNFCWRCRALVYSSSWKPWFLMIFGIDPSS